jgi:hypothetical protein
MNRFRQGTTAQVPYLLHERELPMTRKSIALALGACMQFASMDSFAELNAVARDYVSRLIRGGSNSVRDVAQDLYAIGYADPQVLDVAAEVLLEKYPKAGGDHDAVDAMAWLCRALGKSGVSRYRPVLEQVGNDATAHRKLRSSCEKGADELPQEVSDPYEAGSVDLAHLRDPSTESGAAAARAPAGSLARDTAAVAAGMTSGGRWNPPPANKLYGYGGYELKATTVADKEASKINIDKVVAKVDENIQQSVAAMLKEWNAAAIAGADKIVIAPHIAGVHKSSVATRLLAGSSSGDSYIVLKVTISESSSGKVLAEPEFYRRADATAGKWTFGAHDSAMLQRIADLMANYLSENYQAPVGGDTGWEP